MPEVSATAVRDWLAEVGKPWVKPTPTLPIPIAISSWSASTVSPCFSAKARAVRIASENPTSASPAASGSREPKSASPTLRVRQVREPLRHGADDRDALLVQVERRRPQLLARRRATSAPGTFGPSRDVSASTPSRTSPSTSVRQLVSPRFVITPQIFPSVLSAWTEIPNSRGSWLATRITATPFMNPISTGRERKSARMPSRKIAAERS